MADPAAPAEIPAAAPILPAAESAPPAATPPSPAAGEPGSQPAPATDALAPDAPAVGDKLSDEPKPHTDEASLLETITEKKPDEAKKPDDAKPQDEDGTPKPVFEFKPYTVPEGVKLDEGRFKELNDVLVNDKLDPQARGQELINLHTNEMRAYDKRLRTEQHEAFANTRADWRKQAMGDEEIGGAGWETSKQAIAAAREYFVPKSREKAFNEMLRTTGVGDHPEFLRMLTVAGRILSEPRAPLGDFKPPPDIGRSPTRAGKRGVIYDHPSSANMTKGN